jgi:hypothetical protein
MQSNSSIPMEGNGEIVSDKGAISIHGDRRKDKECARVI